MKMENWSSGKFRPLMSSGNKSTGGGREVNERKVNRHKSIGNSSEDFC